MAYPVFRVFGSTRLIYNMIERLATSAFSINRFPCSLAQKRQCNEIETRRFRDLPRLVRRRRVLLPCCLGRVSNPERLRSLSSMAWELRSQEMEDRTRFPRFPRKVDRVLPRMYRV